jgi:hypothetical protein
MLSCVLVESFEIFIYLYPIAFGTGRLREAIYSRCAKASTVKHNFKRSCMKSRITLFAILLISAFDSIIAQPYQVYAPKYSIVAGAYNHDLLLQLYTESNNVRIFYSTDSSTPDTTSNLYSLPIIISGDKTIFRIKSVTIDSANQYSSITSSYYRIDYSYDTTVFLANLSVIDYQNYLAGHWIGSNENSWTMPYNVDLTVQVDGHYSAHAISCFKYPYGSEVCYPAAFYYGIDNDYPDKKITVLNVDDLGIANGNILIRYDDYSTTNDELRTIKFYNNGNVLKLEQWHFDTYGPLEYIFTRIDSMIVTGLKTNVENRISLYPNPVKEKMSIKFNDNNGIIKIEIRDIFGSLKFSEINKKNLDFINVSSLPNGIYFLSITNNSGNQYNAKFIKTE